MTKIVRVESIERQIFTVNEDKELTDWVGSNQIYLVSPVKISTQNRTGMVILNKTPFTPSLRSRSKAEIDLLEANIQMICSDLEICKNNVPLEIVNILELITLFHEEGFNIASSSRMNLDFRKKDRADYLDFSSSFILVKQ